MMIRDDHLDSEFRRAPYHQSCANAGIHTDDQRNSPRRGLFDDLLAHPIAVLQAMRHVKFGRAAGQFNGALQYYDRCGSVYVVVTVNENFLVSMNRTPKPVERALHAGERYRGVKVI